MFDFIYAIPRCILRTQGVEVVPQSEGDINDIAVGPGGRRNQQDRKAAV